MNYYKWYGERTYQQFSILSRQGFPQDHKGPSRKAISFLLNCHICFQKTISVPSCLFRPYQVLLPHNQCHALRAEEQHIFFSSIFELVVTRLQLNGLAVCDVFKQNFNNYFLFIDFIEFHHN